LRVLGTSVSLGEKARGQLAVILSKRGIPIPIQLPDYSTKELAQKVIGLDMDKLKADKIKLLETVVKEWDAKAEKRQGPVNKYNQK
jgi:nitrite reductase (cytochrome c-552)